MKRGAKKMKGRWAVAVPPNASPRSHRIAALLLAGARPVHIRAGLGVTYDQIFCVRRLLGLPRSPRTGLRKARALQIVPIILAMRQAGRPYREIAATLNTPAGQVASLVTYTLGPLPSSCCRCSAPAKDWHHVSYVPQVAIALCRSCHRREHAPKGIQPVHLRAWNRRKAAEAAASKPRACLKIHPREGERPREP